jgi:hypothetical protein
MNRSNVFYTIPMAVVVFLVATLVIRESAFAQDKSKEKEVRPAVKWEYKVIHAKDNSTKIEEELNKLGEDGWELTSTPALQTGGFGQTSPFLLVLKRIKL